MSTLVILSLISNENKLINFFREKGATSFESSITFNKGEFAEQGYTFLPTEIDIKKVNYIKFTSEGKYYLDETLLKSTHLKWKKIGLSLIAFSFLALFLFFVLQFIF